MKWILAGRWLGVFLVLTPGLRAMPDAAAGLSAEAVAHFAKLALDCVGREYPNKIGHTMASDEDVAAPRELHPAFYGCYDWHSSVHGHWLLARLARLYPEAEFAGAAREALQQSLTREALAAETAYFEGPGRTSFERPYGLAWLLQLAAELREWDDPQAEEWRKAIAPLENLAARRLMEWLPKLDYPVRTGEHSQTAFAFGLAYDWAVTAGHADLADSLKAAGTRLYWKDRYCPMAYEPSGQDFLSPCLAEADFVRRIVNKARYAGWLAVFLASLPGDPEKMWLPVAKVSDRSDPKLAHLDGLNLSRAWMLEGIASALPEGDPRREVLADSARRHRAAGLEAVTGAHYEGGHWLASFATYLVTRRGISD